MRAIVYIAFAAGLFAGATAFAGATPSTSLDMTAQHVNFYSNRYIITGDGGVKVRLSDGTVVSGDTFTMDLKLNRYLIAGDVRIDGATAHERGAAFAGYPDLDRSFFLPEAPGAPEPVRWTYFGMNWGDRHESREQPGDAFFFPDLTGERPYIKADGARIIPRTDIQFDNTQIYTAGVYLPSPKYVVTFGTNSHFYENAFPGARADVGVPFNGSGHSLSAFHVRNDAFNGTYLAFDQHFVWDRDWVVFGIDPLTQEERQYNLIGLKHWNNADARVFLQEQAAQAGIINEPQNAAAYGQFQFAYALRNGANVSYTQNNYWQYILGIPRDATDLTVATGDYDPRWRFHPSDEHLAYNDTERRLLHTKYPLFVRLRGGLDLAHDQYGTAFSPTEPESPRNLYAKSYGGTLYTPPIPVGRLGFTASFDEQWANWSNKHLTQNRDLRLTLAGQNDRLRIHYYVNFETQTSSDYWGSYQNTVYGYDPNFQGFATFRTYTASLVYTPTQWFEANFQVMKRKDFPVPVQFAYGAPPYQLNGDVRIRLARTLLVDFYRSYYFNFADLRWTPQMGIQFSP